MVTATATPPTTLTLQTAVIGSETTAIRSLDWDRARFDIEFPLENGTTYNSFLIEGDQVALVDTSHEKFRQIYLDLLTGLVDPARLDYLIVSHTEPDHSGLIADILQLAPQVTIVATKVALQFLEDWLHQPFQRQQVKSGDTLDLGQGHVLEFVAAPNLHWPDTMLTYDHKSGILFTCDVFGMHYCDDYTFDQHLDLLESDFKIYYDCLMGPNARSVLAALKRMDGLPPIAMIATGHGPLIQHHLTEWVSRYRQWSQTKAKGETSVAIFYPSDYGSGDRLAQSLAHGITKTGVAVDLIDLRSTDSHEIRERVASAAGVVVGMPSQSASDAVQIQALISTLLAATDPKQAFGLFECGGDDDEPVHPLRQHFQEGGLHEAFSPILVKEGPSASLDQRCDEAGTDLGQWLTRDRSIKQMKSLDADLDKALGRISGGLYIITASKDNASSAMLASWVAQASQDPPGISIAVAKDRAIESFMHVGDRFILNVLEEGRYQPLMKHFLKRFQPGADRFAGIKTYRDENGAPILAEALAYLDCEVISRLETPDHWVVYSQVVTGRVSDLDARTAVHHRKVGNHY
ncbi:MAG: MBL fold metallo-hydrolase [Synechococcaceae cyanobacterium SM2_3_2]|nr:MBL fold metallo-hydrolase [Synechococcaceae cyanobacterium SM2_3_2]